ncbi:ABC transporter ATP-binding protein [Thermoproteus tenax]|uniref:Branched-chain amino acid transport system ATP-binding protein n=1 Tax=Thermoproteus tenax (strain ATCC 35583 / DSM 2078 / JCM 9277 / NBRC 100435 / Kra 1) TaxID=768679 RepID=G4RJP0_THETK|nr:ABC transporter ATP-binding protein [Thermoproteus tenax]CCC81785.1 branched-chain amino acid transport system ATP-binding protein [Thermoproteus tenax Kra 1]
MAFLEISNLSAGYGKFHVLNEVTLEIERGEVAVLLGPNGAGKSTLLNAVAGLATIYGGKIALDGVDLVGKRPGEIQRAGVGYVMQSPNNFGTPNIFPELTVRENLLAASTGLSRGDFEKVLGDVLELFPKLKELMHRKAKFLSGGERQMLAISMGLMKRPKLLMLDEPTAGLAPKVASDVFLAVKKIKDMGITILLVEQNARKALEIGDRAFVMVTGRLRYSGPARELDEEKLGRLILGQ